MDRCRSDNLIPSFLAGTMRFFLIPLCILLIFTIFEAVRQYVHYDETVWESHFTTVIFSTVVGSALSLFALRKYRLLDIRLVEEAERRQKLEKEKESYRINLEAIFHGVKDSVLSVDTSFRLTALNESAIGICGFSRDSIGRNVREAFATRSLRCVELLKDTIENGTTNEIERLEYQFDDQRKILSIVTSPLIDPGGNSTGAVMVVKDETYLVDLEKRQDEAKCRHNIVGRSRPVQRICSQIKSLQDLNTTLLITGESGTGKELIVDAIHHSGDRSEKALVKVNCSALPETLLESELFGHTRGAFTGATENKVGRFEMADGGTIFLDEIGDLSRRVQLELLRVIQTKEFERVGDSTPIKVDVRIIAATNRNLRDMVRDGKFREDLFFRLNVVEISVPPLRERREDIPLLIHHFLQLFNIRYGKQITSVSADVSRIFHEHQWPGNVRQLEHALEHAFVFCRGKILTLHDLPEDFRPGKDDLMPVRDNFEIDRDSLIEALKKAAWNKTKAARILGIHRRTLYRKLEQFAITGSNTNAPKRSKA